MEEGRFCRRGFLEGKNTNKTYHNFGSPGVELTFTGKTALISLIAPAGLANIIEESICCTSLIIKGLMINLISRRDILLLVIYTVISLTHHQKTPEQL
jgi:hypothetical protein